MAALLVFIAFLVAVILTIPIGTSMVIGASAPILFMNVRTSIEQLLNNTFSGADSTPILAVPLFILGGVIMAEGGISRRLFNFFAYFVGRFKGGLPCACIITCLFYGAISGSGPATTAAVGSMCVPFLIELGYERKWSAGLIAVAGGLGVIIPPSIPFVLYSLATGVSTGDLFLGGIFPGILIGVALMVYAVIYCIRKGEDRQLINAKLDEMKKQGFWKVFKESFWALLCPVIVLGGIYSGFVTPTEAATLSVIYALIVSVFIYKSVKLKEVWSLICSSIKTYAGLAFVLAFATAFGRVLSLVKATQAITDFLVGSFDSYWAVLAVLTVLFLILGMVMDTGPAIIILSPVLLPAALELGNLAGLTKHQIEIHLGVILVCCLSIGLATPPFGLDLFVAANLSNESAMPVAKKAFPFMISFLIALIAIVFVPWFSVVLIS